MTGDSEKKAAPAVRLRPVEAEDRRRLFDWRNRPEIARWMYTDHEIGWDEHARWFDRALADPSRAYWIIEADAAPAGLVNLYDLDPRNARCGWAFYLAGEESRGRGVGAHVEFLALEEVFVRRGLNKLWCEVLVENEAVLRLHRSFGFRQEALFRQHVFKQGRFHDVAGLGLLREEWLAAREASRDRLAARGHAVHLSPLS